MYKNISVVSSPENLKLDKTEVLVDNTDPVLYRVFHSFCQIFI